MNDGVDLCIGRYCGYPPQSNASGVWQTNKCGVCPWGFRTNETKFCVKCEDKPELYDWLFLGFMALLPCMLHWLCILRSKQEFKLIFAQLIISTCECVSASIFALLSTEPKGSLGIVSCGVHQLSDWYTMLHNPQIRYTQTLHCSQEAVYPLMTIVFIYLAYSLLLIIFFRPILFFIASSKLWRDPVYAALYFHPILVITHAFIGGLLYYSFPYITVLLSLIALIAYFVWMNVTKLNVFIGRLIVRNILVTLWHGALLAFGIVAMSYDNYFFVLLTPIPVLFYFLTLSFTDVDNIKKELDYP